MANTKDTPTNTTPVTIDDDVTDFVSSAEVDGMDGDDTDSDSGIQGTMSMFDEYNIESNMETGDPQDASHEDFNVEQFHDGSDEPDVLASNVSSDVIGFRLPKNPPPKKGRKHYVTNKQILIALRESFDQDELSTDLVRYFIMIVNGYAMSPSYAQFKPHIEDMKSEALVNLCKVWRGFNIEKYDNPFAYYTQAIKHSFWRYTKKEKIQRLARDNILINIGELPSDTFMAEYADEQQAIKDGIPPEESK